MGPLAIPILFAAATASATGGAVNVVAVPFSSPHKVSADVLATALESAVANAVPLAAKERGLGSVRADSVKPVAEALARCRDDGCRIGNARRLGARWAILGALDNGALTLRMIDVDVGDVAASVRVEGDTPSVLARAPRAVDELVEKVAPKTARSLARARTLRARGDLEGADAAFAEAVDKARPVDVVALWLERARLYDADREREASSWDALAAAVGPGSVGFAALGDDDKERVKRAVHDHLAARATWDERSGHKDEAARAHLKIAALFPDDGAQETFLAALLLPVEDARPLLKRLAHDEGADEETRLKALLALHAHE